MLDAKVYRQHRNDTKGRIDKNGYPIEFKLTWDDWFDIWYESGVWHLRGQGKGHYVMSRYGDLGHYEVGNVHIQSKGANTREGHIGFTHSEETKRHISESGRGRPSPTKGLVMSRTQKDRISAALTGREKKPETIEKLRQAAIRNAAKKKALH